MRAAGWTVDAGPSNVASRSESQRADHGPPQGGISRYGRADARATETDAGNPAFLGRHAEPANCACSAATPAARSISRRARSARPAPRARSACSRPAARRMLWSYVIHHRPVPGFTPPYAIAVVQLAEGPRMMTNIVDCPQTPEALAARHAAGSGVREAERHHHAAAVPSGEGLSAHAHETSVAVVGAAETTELGVIPDMSQIQLHADAALNAMADCRAEAEGHRRRRHRRRDAACRSRIISASRRPGSTAPRSAAARS